MAKVTRKLAAEISQQQFDFVKTSLFHSFPDAVLELVGTKIKYTFFDDNKLNALGETIDRLVFISRGLVDRKVLFSNLVTPQYSSDPLVKLKETSQVTEIDNGLFQFQGEFLEIFKTANNVILDIAISEYGAIEQENPILWPIELFKKINYLNEFPGQALLISGVEKNFEAMDAFSKKYSSETHFLEIDMTEHMEPAKYGLQPAVCDTCYYAMQNKSDIKDTIFTTYNKVFRNEKSDAGSLDRLNSFSVRDIMFVGDKNFVLGVRQQLLERLASFFDETCLRYSIETADDPFFSSTIEKKMYQHLFELKYEILVEIPYLNKRIAVGSINLHLDTFGQAFNISQGDRPIYSGCIGIGFERFLLALYSQHGVNTSTWPSAVKKLLNLT